MNNMTYSSDGLHLTESFEGFSLVAYADIKGIPTIGYGHTSGVNLGDTCTQEQADAWLQEDIAWAASVVNKEVTVQLTQPEFDALTDLCFNIGSGHFSTSTVLRDLNEGNFEQAAQAIEMWDIAGGVVCAGLLRRRIAEESEFNSTTT